MTDVVQTVDQCINIYDFEAIASRTVKQQGWVYYSSGADDEITLRENHNAFHRIFFRPRVLVDVKEVDTTTTILGHKVALPIFCSAIAMCKLGHPEGEVAWQKACGAEGIIYMIPTLSSCSLNDIVDARAEDQTMFFQLYVNQDREKTKDIVQRAEKLGCKALFITVDAPQLGNREKDRRVKISHSGASVQKGATGAKSQGTSKALTTFIDPSLCWADIEWFQSITNMKIVLKGIATAEDAIMALEHGVQGILLSNHGGRQLDFARSAIECLPEVMAALKKHPKYTEDFEVYIDGGIRRGTDVIKALALGAKAVGVGRPALYAMSAFGTAGVQRMIQIFREEIEMGMRLMGTKTIADITEDMVIIDELSKHVAPVPVDFLQQETYITKMTQAVANKLERRLGDVLDKAAAGDSVAKSSGASSADSAVSVTISEFTKAIMKTIFTLDPRTSIHRTGLFLTLYLIVHVTNNMAVFGGPRVYNELANQLSTNIVIKAVEIYLLLAAVLHIVVGSYLTIQYKKFSVPRGKSPFTVLDRAKLAITGSLISGFLVVHLLHFRFASIGLDRFGLVDFYGQQASVLKDPPVTALYIMGPTLVGVHLWYGWEKTVNKLGLTGDRKGLLKPVAKFGQYCVIPIVLGFIAVTVKSFLM